jgi:hypothetical protein
MDGEGAEGVENRPAPINAQATYHHEITTESRPEWTTIDANGNKKASFGIAPKLA